MSTSETSPERPSSHRVRDFLIIVGLAAAVRWLYFNQVRHLLLFHEALGDAAQYVSLAAGIRRDGLMAPPGQAFFQAPFYPFFLALFGDLSLVWPRLVQFGAGVLSAGLAWDTGRRLAGDRAGLVAGVLAAVYGPAVFFEGELLSICWALLFLQAAVWLVIGRRETSSPVPVGLAGAALGLSGLAQPNALLVAVFLAAWFVLGSGPGRHSGGLKRRDGLMLLAGLALVILPVTLRNRLQAGEWIVVSANGGINFFIGNNPEADGSFHLPAGEPLLNRSEGLQVSAAEAASLALGRPAGPGAASGYWMKRGLDFWFHQPLGAVSLLARKTLYLFNATELPNHYDIGFFRRRVPVLRLLPGFLLLFPLAAWGALRSLGSPGFRPLLAAAGAYAVSVILFFVTDRYRLPWAGILYPLAGLGAVDLALIVRRRRTGEIATVLTVLVALVFQCAFRLVDTRPGQAHMHNLLGTLHYQKDQLGAARSEFERALALDPGSAETMNNLGRIALLNRSPDEARDWFQKAIDIDARLPEAWFNLEELHRNRGRAREAMGALDGLESNVASARAQWGPALAYRRGLNHLLLGDSAAARAGLEESVRLKPDLAGAHAALGGMYFAAGETGKARVSFQSAARLSPEQSGHHYNLGLVAEALGDYSAALSAYQEARRLAPDNLKTAYRAGLMLHSLGRTAEAWKEFQALAGRRFGPAFYQIGRLHELEGRREEALQAYRRAVQAGGPEPEVIDAGRRIRAMEGSG